MSITQTINALSTIPDIGDPDNFESETNTFLVTDLPAFQTQMNTWAGQANSLAAAMNAAAAGGAISIGYTFSTTTTDSDPGAGYMRLNQATQNTATVLRLDLLDAAGSDWTSAIDLFDDSTSTVKGYIKIEKVNDGTKYLIFAVASLASPSGYRNVTGSIVASSAASPFANGDSVVIEFSRTGDKGETGPTGTVGGTAGSTVDLLTGSNIASASTVNLDTATGNRVHITGTTTISAVTLTRGPRTVIFDGVLTLTHHSTNNNLPGGANITTAAGDRAIYEADGTTVYCVSYIKASGAAVVVTATGLPYLNVRDQKTSGTDGGTFTSGAWQTRTLNTTGANSISGASLGSNRITLPAGTFQIRARAPSVDGTLHKAKLYNITDTADVILGSNSQATGSAVQTDSWVIGQFTIAGAKVFELQHRIEVTSNTYGLGRACNFGTEVYTEIEIWKVA